MNKEFYDKYQKDLDCKSCIGLQECSTNSNIPLCDKGYRRFAKDKIAELEQQLAETEQKFLEFQEDSIRNEQIYVRELTEKDKTIAKLEEDNGYILFEDGYDENGKEVHRQVYKTYKQAFNEQVLETKKLRRQLREKDEELEELKSQQTHTQQVCDKYHSLYEEKFNRVLELAQEKHELEQSQTQLAIQELAEVERLLYESHYKEIDNRYYAEYEDIKNLIDSRIKALEELKGAKDVKD